MLLEEDVGPGVGLSGQNDDGLIGTAHLFPVHIGAVEDLAELIKGEFADRIIVVDHHRNAV